MNINYQRSPKIEQFITVKISGNALKPGPRMELKGNAPQMFCVSQNFVVPRKFFIKIYNKNKNFASIKTHFAPPKQILPAGLFETTE